MKKIISLAVICFLLLGLCACSSEPTLVEPTKGGNNTPTTATTAAAEEKSFKVGDTVKLNDVEVTFVGITKSTGSDFFMPAEGKEFVLCEFEISNKSDNELSVSSILSFEAYYDDYACEISISALANKGDKDQLDGTVAAGKKMKGVVGYEIPTDWKEFEIHYTPDILRSEEIVFVANNG